VDLLLRARLEKGYSPGKIRWAQPSCAERICSRGNFGAVLNIGLAKLACAERIEI